MSWHTNALLIGADFSKDYPGLLKKLGLEGGEVGEMVSFDDAASIDDESVAIATVDGWTALWGCIGLYMVDDKGLAKIAKKADVFEMILEGSSGTAGFSWWTGGKKVRDWMRQDGKMIKDEGEPLPQEKKAFAKKDSDEQAVLRMLMSLTLTLKKLQDIEYQMYELSEVALFGEEG
jgi:hypothetical protein